MTARSVSSQIRENVDEGSYSRHYARNAGKDDSALIDYGLERGKAMTKKLPHGDCGIDPRGENCWRLRYRVNRKRYTKTFHGPLSEARKELRRLIRTG